MPDLTRTAAHVSIVYPTIAEVYDVILAETTTSGQALHQNSSGNYALADANVAGKQQFRGLALKKGGAGQAVSMLKRGHVAGFDLSGLAYDALVYLSDTPGELADTASATKTVPCGRVVGMTDPDRTKVLYIDAAWGTNF